MEIRELLASMVGSGNLNFRNVLVVGHLGLKKDDLIA
jgi:hypothetical protein